MNRADILLHEIIEKLRVSNQVQAVWLAGSRGRGTNDEFSDIDIWVALDDAAMPFVVEDPLVFVHSLVPTVMEIIAPSIAPQGGAFLGCWVPVEDEFVQVDWYLVPKSRAEREPDTVVVLGDAPVRETIALPALPNNLVLEKVEHNLALAMQSINNMLKNARRGKIWDAANNARNGAHRLSNAQSLLDTGEEPDFVAAKRSILPEPPPASVREVQDLALGLLDEISSLSSGANVDLDHAIAAIRNQIINCRETNWIPTEEYYRTLPRRYLGAGVLFTDTDDNILLLETTYKDVHEIPGGVCESGEAPRMTARREIREELGIDVEPGKLLVMDTRTNAPPKGDAVMYVYDGGVLQNPSIIRPDGNEIARVKFVPAGQLHQFCTPPMAIRLQAAMTARNQNQLIEISDSKIIS